ncbi:pantoate--beta-alanine ligase [Fimbriimonas ginsengisoli]|uniref:Pantothenate synthetase n=1 Tax=Fimbriimonas ginsengisoli Gsoil 348 TaxID=661478 RepID=A0A068NZ01_FIMGI|nr:pantoate--beta-alanine ligase [Fimbriimonas ginsengisoli]AIE87714.1 Pantothenate synthetase [Fimbriimonas ginsengisoli Gsoil 348]
MKIVRKARELPPPSHRSIGFVPTMGAFHEGHLDLMRRARRETDIVVVSLFVNPTQFGKGEDFSRYPRDLDRDSAMAEGVGVDILFVPDVSEVYPHLPSTSIKVPEVSSRWEGAARPTHFEGVATVVGKLFNMVRPDIAFFGQKDLQQCAVIRRMVEDLYFSVRLEICPTTREADGLAMSSRNAYLSEDERRTAPALFRELTRCVNTFKSNSFVSTEVETELARSREELTSVGFDVDYFEWVSYDDLLPVRDTSQASAVIVAAKIGRTRLIDNIVL